MYVVTLSVFHNLAIWLLYVNKPEPEMTNFEPSLVHSLLCTYQSTTKYSGPCTLMLQQLCYSQRLIKALPTACVKSLIEYIRTVATTVPVYSRRCI